MLDMTTACATCARPVRRLRPKPLPLLLLPAQRVDVPAGVDLLAKARAGRVAALAEKAERRAAAFQPPETILIDPAFRARLEAIAARRVVTACTNATSRPLAAG